MVAMIRKAGSAVGSGWTRRSFKRETALFILIFWCWLTQKYFNFTDATLATAMSPAYNTATMVVLPIVAAAFGYDAWFKQGPGSSGK